MEVLEQAHLLLSGAKMATQVEWDDKQMSSTDLHR